MVYTANYGQLDNNVRFYVHGGGLWFTDDGVWFEIKESIESRVQSRESDNLIDPMRHLESPKPQLYKRVILKLEFMDSNQVEPIGRERLSWDSNFFYGNDSSKWCTNVPNFNEIYYENIYDSIDLRYYTDQNGLKYDFIVRPGADINQIRLKYRGAGDLKIDKSGNLIIETKLNALMDSKPLIYQDLDGVTSEVLGRFRLYGKNIYGFEVLSDYHQDEILIIDPLIKLDFSTYIGGSGYEEGIDIVADNNGSSYLTGFTSSSNFPITTGAYDTSVDGGFFGDVFVLKLKENGSAPEFSTYIGGSKEEIGIGLEFDSAGNVFVAGQTSSSNFPKTNSAFDTTYNGTFDAFVLKLNYNGSKLIYSTYLGGDGWEVAFDIDINTNGQAFVTGSTDSLDFPTTQGSYDTALNNTDCFVVKLNNTGTGLIYSTLVGGSKVEMGYGIAIDSNGNAYIAGITNSTDFPTSNNAYDTSYNINYDVCVFKLDWNGTNLVYSTFVGGSSLDMGWAITIDSAGNSYITGWTTSMSFPITGTAYDTSINGDEDIIVFKLNWNGSKLLYSTFIGGNNADESNSIVFDSMGNIVVAGTTFSSNFPTTKGAWDRVKNGSSDHFMLILDINNSTLIYSTFIGGSGDEHKNFDAYFCRGRVATNQRGHIFVIGETTSSDFNTTNGALDSSFNGQLDAIVLKFFLPSILNITSLSLLKFDDPVYKIYSRDQYYTFRVSITDSYKPSVLHVVHLYLDPMNTNLQVIWDASSGQFKEIADANDYINLEPTSNAYKASWDKWTIDFNLTFNWTYPDEAFHDVKVLAISALLIEKWFNVTELYQVENDLVFTGDLEVRGKGNRTIGNNSIVGGGEILNWTGLIPIYEGTEDLYPSAEEVDITIWDEHNNSWCSSPAMGSAFELKTSTPKITNNQGSEYIINLTGIPPECDHTNTKFTIKIDHDNVTFSNPKPDRDIWQRTANVIVGVTITDNGGSEVNGSSIEYTISNDNGTSWSAWEGIPNVTSKKKLTVQAFSNLEEGKDNYIKWRAFDTLANGPAVSEPYSVLVDTEGVKFSNFWPTSTEESPTDVVFLGITISDLTSGVDASTIRYRVSYNAGKSWYYWKSVTGFEDGNEVNVNLNLKFPNGTDNRIKWEAYDIVGNGPMISDEYIIKVNKITQPIIPKVELIAPENNSIITSTSVELSWKLKQNRTELLGVTYDVMIDEIYPPLEINDSKIQSTRYVVNNLEDGKTYYWTIIPKTGGNDGICTSGTWSFSVDIVQPKPEIFLLSPKNGSTISALRPNFIWSIIYQGTEDLTYDIYIGENKSPKLETQDYHDTSYLSKYVLEFGNTYYWQVLVKAGDDTEVRSELWRFSIKPKKVMPRFELKLDLYPSVIELCPNETKFVSAVVTNLGDVEDNIILTIPKLSFKYVEITISPLNINNIAPNRTAEFNISIRAKANAIGNITKLMVIATSSNATNYFQVAEDSAILTIKILEKEIYLGESASTAIELWIIVLIIILIMIGFVIFGFYNRVKKKHEKGFSLKPQSTIPPPVNQSKTSIPVNLTEGASKLPAVQSQTSSRGSPMSEFWKKSRIE